VGQRPPPAARLTALTGRPADAVALYQTALHALTGHFGPDHQEDRATRALLTPQFSSLESDESFTSILRLRSSESSCFPTDLPYPRAKAATRRHSARRVFQVGGIRARRLAARRPLGFSRRSFRFHRAMMPCRPQPSPPPTPLLTSNTFLKETRFAHSIWVHVPILFCYVPRMGALPQSPC
jgi:hypothetical protein